MVKVLVVDDSPSSRALLVMLLESDPEIKVVGEARNGLEAVEKTQKLRPNVVTMDLELPLLDGLQAAEQIMTQVPTPIVIVSGTSESRQADFAMKALSAGALAVYRKPGGPDSPGFQAEAGQIIEGIKAMAEVKVVRRRGRRISPSPTVAAPQVPAQRLRDPASQGSSGKVVAIASSTGGPPVLEYILARLPSDFPAPILIVQHIAPGFLQGLVTWLAGTSKLPVKIACAHEPLQPGQVYLAPDGYQLEVTNRVVTLNQTAPVGGFSPSGTALFESVARTYGSETVAVILTGMGRDGVAGLRTVRFHGGWIIAQDEATSVVFGMPGEAVKEGLADAVLPPEGIVGELLELCRDRLCCPTV